MLGLEVCHDYVSLSQVMDLDYFVYDFVIFSRIDDYDGVFGDLEWVKGEFKLAIK